MFSFSGCWSSDIPASSRLDWARLCIIIHEKSYIWLSLCKLLGLYANKITIFFVSLCHILTIVVQAPTCPLPLNDCCPSAHAAFSLLWQLSSLRPCTLSLLLMIVISMFKYTLPILTIIVPSLRPCTLPLMFVVPSLCSFWRLFLLSWHLRRFLYIFL